MMNNYNSLNSRTASKFSLLSSFLVGDNFIKSRSKQNSLILSLLMIFLLLSGINSNSQTVQIGSGTATISGAAAIPVTNYNFTYSQQIITSAEIIAGGGPTLSGQLLRIRYKPSSIGTLSVWNNWTVYIGNTSKTSFTSNTDWVSLANMTQVFSGVISPDPTSGNWFDIIFTAPFNYNGGNLVVAVDENSSGFTTNPTFSSYTASSNRAIYYRNDSTNPNPSSPPTATGRLSSVPQMQLYFQEYPCSGTPNPGNTVASNSAPCYGSTVNLSLQNATSGTGVTYQWYNSAGAISGATSATYTTPALTASNTYYCAVTCSGVTTNSNSVTFNPLPVTTFPWTETFDTTSSTVGCWSSTAGSGAITQWTTATAAPANGPGAPAASSRFAFLNVYNANTTFNTYNYSSPTLTLGSSLKRLTYKYYLGTAGYKGTTGTTGTDPFPLIVQISVDGGSFTSIYSHSSSNSTFATSATSPWQSNTIDLSSYANSDVKFRFVSNSNYGFGFTDQGLDEIVVENIPSCVTPTALTSSSVMSSSASIGWTAPSIAPASGYDYYLSTTNTAPTGATTPTGNVSTTSASLTGLTANTPYYFWVRSNCNSSDKSSWGSGTFTTPCASVSIPTALETFTSTTLPACWSSSLISGTTAWGTTTSNDGVPSPRTGTYFMGKSYTTSDALVVSQPINMTTAGSAGATVDVWIYRNTVNYSTDRIRFHVNTQTNLTGASQILEIFPLISVAPSVSAAGWYNYKVLVPSSYNSSTALYVIAQGTTSGGFSSYGIGFDDLVVYQTPTCVAPTALTSSAVTNNSATIGWTASSTPPAGGYDYYYSTNGTAPTSSTTPSGNVGTTTYSASLTGLTANTTYYYWVRSNCSGSDISTWAGSGTFLTQCDPVSSFSENFDTVTTPNLPSCWTKILRGSTLSSFAYLNSTTTTPFSSPNCIQLYNYNSATSGSDDIILVSPPVSNLSTGTYRLKFYAAYAGGSVKVGTLNNNTSTATFTPLQTISTTGTWTEYIVNFNTYTGTDKFIGIRMNNSSTYTYMYIDNVVWQPIPTCFEPTALTTSAITTTTATISWTAPVNGSPASYEYEVRTSGAAGSGATGLVTSGTITSPTVTASLTGLTSNTNYSVYVRTFCGGTDYSYWTNATTFKTLCDNVITYPFVESFDANSSSLGCWSVSQGSGASYAWAVTTADATNGAAGPASSTRFAYLNVYNAFTTYNTYNLTTPTFTLNSVPKRLKYNYFLGSGGYTTTPVPLALQISVDGGVTYTTIYSHTSTNSTFATASTSAWQSNTIDLSAYAGQNVIFKFVSNSNYGSGTCNQGLDQVTVENIPPAISSFTPTAVCGGNNNDTITITGTNLANATSVTFNSVAGTIVSNTATQITATIPAGTTTGVVVVTTPGGSGTSGTSLTVNPYPTVAAISGNATTCYPATLNLTNTTPGGVWSSSDSTIATVDGNGIVTPIAAGTATISYAVTTSGCATTNTKSITVYAPVIIDALNTTSSQSVINNAPSSFTVSATGSDLSYQWYVSTDSGANYNPVDISDTNYSGSTSATLSIATSAPSMDGYLYYCTVSGAFGCSSSTSTAAVLNVNDAGITVQPSNVILCSSGAGTASFTTTGLSYSNGTLTYAWYIVDTISGLVPITDYDANNPDPSGIIYSGSSTNTLSLSGITVANNGLVYACIVTGPTNFVTSNGATLLVRQQAAITADPVAQTNCYTGGTAVFGVTATGDVTSYQWKYATSATGPWTNVVNGTPVGVTYVGATSASLTATTTASTPDAGTYYYQAVVTSTSPCSAVTSASAQLIINKPAVTSQPTAVITAVGTTATYTVTTSAASPTYQWQYSTNGTTGWANVANATPANITYTGATSSSLSVVIANAAGASTANYYRVVITSGGCSNYSNAAQLTVNTYCTSNPTSNDGSGITQAVVGATTFTIPDQTYISNLTPVVDLTQTLNSNVQITFATGYDYDTNLWIDFNNDGDFTDSGELLKSATSTSDNPTVLDMSFVMPLSAPLGQHRMRIGSADSGQVPPVPCYSGSWGVTLDFTVNVLAAPPCSGTPTPGNSVTSNSSICTSVVNPTTSLSLQNFTSGAGVTYQWQSSSTQNGTYTDIAGATTPQYVASLTGETWFQCNVTCSGATGTSTPVGVKFIDCNYTITRNTAITYNSVMTTGTSYASLSSADDGKTEIISLAGTTFKYKGQPVTGFYATSNGWLTFNPNATSSTYVNNLSTASTNIGSVLAPFWEDLVIKGNTLTNKDVSMKYQINGTLGSGTADIIIEWSEMEKFLYGDPNLNFQVVLHEADNSIDFNYGNMQMFNGSSNNTSYGYWSYSLGLDGGIMLQAENSNFFSGTTQNALKYSINCNSQYHFVPSANLSAGTAPTSGQFAGSTFAPVNNNTSGAITLPLNPAPCTNTCGTIYSTTNATASTGITACNATTAGTPDDDVFFSFTTSNVLNYRITVDPSTSFDPVIQILDASFVPVTCVNASGAGISESIVGLPLSINSLYYVRVYDAASGTPGTSLGNGEFAICVSENILPPANDDPTGAITLSVGSSCSGTSSVLPATLAATGTTGITACTATSPGNADDDIWYKFTTGAVAGTNYTLTAAGVSTYNAVLQLFSGTPGSLTSVSCVNSAGNGAAETITSNTLTPNTDYYIRVYHFGNGANNGNVSVCVYAPTPACITSPVSPTDASSLCAASPITLSWSSVTNASGYNVYLDSGSGPATTLVSANQAGTSYSALNLAAGTYSWRVEPVNGTSAATSCSDWTFTVNPLPTATVSGSVTVCQNDASPSITFTGANGTAPYTFRYKIGTGSNQTVTTTSGNSVTVSVPTSTAGTFVYNLIRVTDNSTTTCFQNQTGSATVIVNPTSVAGTASGTTTLCYGSATSVSLSGNTGTIQWQQSADGSSWSDISGATTASLSTGNLTATTYYQAVVTSGVCPPATSNMITVTVNPTSVAGSVTSNTIICSGTGITVSVSGSTGTIQWQQSADGISGWTDIAGATTASYATGNLSSTTYYHAVVTSGVCSSATTSSVRVQVNANVTYYADADHDGYGNAAVSQVSCMGAPSGYVANSTDCDDTRATTNPGAVDICSDGIDNDCNGTIDNVGLPGGCAPIVSYVIPSQCGSNLSAIDTQIFAALIANAQGYRWKVTKMIAGSPSTNSADVQMLDTTLRAFRLTQLASFAYATSYQVEVAVKINNNWQPYYGTACTVTTPTPTTTLVNTQCGSTLNLIDDQVMANIVSFAQGYRWRITKMIDGTPSTNSSDIQTIVTSLRAFKFTQLTTYAFATTYQVEVAVKVNNAWMDYGTGCTISTPTPTTKVTTAQCGTTLSLMTDVVYANIVAYATGYRFKVTNLSTNAFQTIDRTLREFRFNLLSNIPYSTQFKVEVAVRNTDGTYMSYGQSCNVTTPAFPTTSLQDSQCDYVAASNNELVYAKLVANATNYRFNFTNTQLSYGYTFDTTLRSFALNTVPGLTPNTTYSVKVAVKIGGVWGPYNKVCTLTTPGTSKPITAITSESNFDATAYPNPFAANFKLNITTTSSEALQVKVYDMLGKLIENSVIDPIEVRGFEVGNNYPSGVYNVIVSQGDQIKTLRVIKR